MRLCRGPLLTMAALVATATMNRCWCFPFHPPKPNNLQRFSRTISITTVFQVQVSKDNASGELQDESPSPSPTQRERQEDPFLQAMRQLGYSSDQRDAVLSQLSDAGLWSGDDPNSRTLQTVTTGLDGGTTISTLLIQDFGLSPLQAHQTRAALQQITREEVEREATTEQIGEESPLPFELRPSSERPNIKSFIVNEAAQRRAAAVDTSYEYGLPRNYEQEFPRTAAELDDFVSFMTLPTTDSQGETPLRSATATTYIHHAKLFLGWYWNYYMPELENQGVVDSSDKENLSIYKVFPTKEKESANSILIFLQWLRSTRNVSVSYEANLLRGLGKLLKFRFRKESTDDGEDRPFGDLPVLRELRKWHNDANRRQKVAPRVSDEDRKWLSWPEYLLVVQSAGSHLLKMIQEYDTEYGGSQADTQLGARENQTQRSRQRTIAAAFQKYLILSFFSYIPDRQRTIRELEIGRSFVKNDQNQYTIKHKPDDYKTGNTYGERPPLLLPVALTEEIDEFLTRWRPSLGPFTKKAGSETNRLFLQVRTGKPLTSDSVYHIVSTVCYHYTGKRTNPHLLRDMIVTHVRESSDASEQQLEALALFMGHSVAVQRKSYDRRTLTKKVEPAVALMEQVNKSGGRR